MSGSSVNARMPDQAVRGNYKGWNTDDERTYLNWLGKWGSTSETRMSLLTRYASSITNRTVWGAIDRAEIRAHVNMLIAQESRR